MEREKVKEYLNILPHREGVYIFKNKKDKIIYIGKAKDLNKRIRSYFQNKKNYGLQDYKTNLFFEKINKIDYIVTDSEVEALILESNLIKKNRPQYNVELKDDKSYPFIIITEKENFPRVFLTRNRNIRGAKYFGPYTNVRAARKVLEVLRKTFKIRDCKKSRPGKGKNIPCLNYHINLCSAPCVQRISREEYKENIEYVSMFLKGKDSSIRKKLLTDIKKLSKQEKFEDAAVLREKLESISKLYQSQKIVIGGENTWDVLGFSKKGDMSAVSYFSYRNGELAVVNNFLIENVDYMEVPEIIYSFIMKYYKDINNMPSIIYIPEGIPEINSLEEWIKEEKGRKIKIKVPKSGDKKNIMEMAARNASLYIDKKRFEKDTGHSDAYKGLIKLQKILGLNNIPRRMECYDISNLGHSFPVGSMVVFEDGAPLKKNYRHFKVKEVPGQDDYRMIEEVLSRRLKYLEGASLDIENSFYIKPGLIIIDGGKGQFSTASRLLEDRGLDDIDLISIAKKEEKIFCTKYLQGIRLNLDENYMRTIIKIRDEAHRFAVSYHKKIRGKYMTASLLDSIKGIGEKKKSYIMQTIKGINELRNSSIEELMNIKGISYRDAKNIYNFLHK